MPEDRMGFLAHAKMLQNEASTATSGSESSEEDLDKALESWKSVRQLGARSLAALATEKNLQDSASIADIVSIINLFYLGTLGTQVTELRQKLR